MGSRESETKDRRLNEDFPDPTAQQPSRRGSKEDLSYIPVFSSTELEVQEAYYIQGNSLLLASRYAESIEYLKKACQYPLAQAVLGFCYDFGLGVEQNFSTAEKLYLKAASKQIGLAFARLSFLRFYGRPNVIIDRAEAEEWKRKSMLLGEGCLDWLRIAAESNIPSALYAYGVCYHDGVAVAKDADIAISYYRQAAALGDARGEGVLGYCYGEGFGVEKNQAIAFEYYLKGAMKGETVSMYNVGYCYEQALSVTRSLPEAIKWYRKSANLGNCYAQNSLGYIYEEGQGIEKDEKMAVYWYNLSAHQGYPWSQCNYAFCLQNGLGIEKNPTLAFYWYHKAALQSHSRAQHNLGHLYQYGLGVEKDEVLAVEWYERSSTHGNAFAMHSLGYCYRTSLINHRAWNWL